MTFKTSELARKRQRRWVRKNRDHAAQLKRESHQRHRDERCRAMRERYAAKYAADPQREIDRVVAFNTAHPEYRREWRQRRKLKLALTKFAAACAAGRRSVQQFTEAECASST